MAKREQRRTRTKSEGEITGFSVSHLNRLPFLMHTDFGLQVKGMRRSGRGKLCPSGFYVPYSQPLVVHFVKMTTERQRVRERLLVYGSENT